MTWPTWVSRINHWLEHLANREHIPIIPESDGLTRRERRQHHAHLQGLFEGKQRIPYPNPAAKSARLAGDTRAARWADHRAALPFVRGTDGLTWLQRRQMARRFFP